MTAFPTQSALDAAATQHEVPTHCRTWSYGEEQSLHLCIDLSVLQKAQQNLRTLLWPSSLSCGLPLVLGLSSSANTPAEAVERDHPLVGQHILQVLLGLVELHVPQCVGRFTRVLEVHTHV